MHMPPPNHECYETFTYPRFVEGDYWVDLIVQDLTETVGHKKTEKRLLHVMLEGPGDMKFMHDMAMDYLATFYYPIQEKRAIEGKSIDLPRLDHSTLGWLPLLQGGLHAALTYFKIESENNCDLIASPTCTPHLYVINPCKKGEILYVAVVPALHALDDQEMPPMTGQGGDGECHDPHPHGGDGQ